MDPVTHLLTGATLARSGFNRKAAYATLAMTLAAEAPDLDTVWGLRGPVAGFEHHRGITHTFVGLPFEAVAVLALVYAIHRVRVRYARSHAAQPDSPHQTPARPAAAVTIAPVRWGLLYGFILIALLSHLLLDWTNNYGIRPFFPFNPRWYALSTVFIVEPVILLLLLGALLAPALFGLIAGEVGARKRHFRGRGWAIAALLGIVALWTLRQVEHDSAVQLASVAPYGPAGAPVSPTDVLRVTASPSPINPFLWHTVVETPGFFQLAAVDTRRSVVDTDPARDLFYKPATSLSTLIAKRSWLGRVYLDWSSWPLVTDVGAAASPTSAGTAASAPDTTEVTFRDLRFFYDAPTINWRRNPPLGGEVFVDLAQPEHQRIAAMVMNNGVQR